MIIYLAGVKTIWKQFPEIDFTGICDRNEIYWLSSFWEAKSGLYGEYVNSPYHILDSGAFSAFSGKHNSFDWDDYVDKYIKFIKQTNQQLFFELDIDVVVGLERVEYYRNKITDAVGIQPIPVWHSNRGKDYFIKMCEEFPYVSLGTTKANEDGKKIRRTPEVLSWFIDEAHKRGKKIHGLGFTNTSWLKYLKFDSVDSTSWLGGGRFGQMFWFKNNDMININHIRPVGKKVDSYKANEHNLKEWLKFQRYALNNL